MEQTMIKEKQQTSKLMRGIVVGGVIGGCISLIDKKTRNSVSTKATDLKNSSVNVLTHVKENPGEVKEQILDQVKQATDTLKNTINEAKHLADRINSDVVEDVKDITDETASFAEDTKEELREMKSNVKETSSKLRNATSNNKPQTQAELNANLNPY